MPGFYERQGDAMHWETFAPLPGTGSLEMSIAEADQFFSETLPSLKRDLMAEGCPPASIDFHFSMCRPGNGRGYGQICARGTAPIPAWALGPQRRSGY